MTCDEIRAQYLDRDIDLPGLEAAARIAQHFAECPACRQAAGQYDQLRSLLKLPDADDTPEPEPADLPLPDVEPFKSLRLASQSPRRFIPAIVNAALVLLALAGWGLYLAHRQGRPTIEPQTAGPAEQSRPPRPDAPLPANLPWSRADIARGAAVFSKVSESFDGRAAWVAVGDRASDVGLIDGPAARPPKVLLVRLLMSQGDQPTSKTDLVIVPGQEVSVDLPFQAKEVLRYRIKTAPGAAESGRVPQLTLSAEVRSLEQGETLAALATQFQPRDGQALSAGRLQSPSGPYNLDVSFSETTLPSVQ